MQNAVKRVYEELGSIVIASFDYFRLLFDKPYNEKGKLDKSNYRKNIDNANKIKEKVTGIEYKSKLDPAHAERQLEIDEEVQEIKTLKAKGEITPEEANKLITEKYQELTN